ncbi:hypothetical protein BH23ACT11_BH23ACT11_17980 [soil metagenome]
MNLKRKSAISAPPEATWPAPRMSWTNTFRALRGARWAGVLLAVAGVMMISLVIGEAAAGTVVGGATDDRLHGTAGAESFAGRDGEDSIYGYSGDDGLSGGEGGDQLFGGAGRDVMLGGRGDDLLEARDGRQDYVDCGPGGHDVASVDAVDQVSPSCEVVYEA